MKFLKFIFVLLIILTILIIIIYSFIKLSAKINFANYTARDNKKEKEFEINKDGIIFKDFDTNNIKGAFFAFVNGENSVKVVKYNLNEKILKTVLEIKDMPFEYYVPGKVLLDSSNKDIYYILHQDDKFKILKYKFFENKPEEIFSISSYNLLGMYKFADKLYVTAYREAENNLYDLKLIQINLSDLSINYIYENDEDSNIPILINIKDDKYFFRFYNRYTNKLTQDCFSSISFDKISCAEALDLDFVIKYRTPEGDNGFDLGKPGFLQKEYKDNNNELLLNGVIDEQFESPFVVDDRIYFLSGQIVPFDVNLNSDNFGSFVPNSIEYLDETKKRIKLVNLPSSKQAYINYANEDFVLLSIELLSSNKYKTNPLNLWYLNLKTNKLEQITKIECTKDRLCEVKFLEFNDFLN